MQARRQGVAVARILATGIVVASTAFTVFLAPAPAGAGKPGNFQVRDDFIWNGNLSRGDKITINGINGDIVADGTTRGSEVVITATKSARRSDPDDVMIKVTEYDGGVTICALYPNRHGDYAECGEDAVHQNVKDNDVRVDFRVRVPAGVALVARTVNGKIDADRLMGPVTANTVNGSVAIVTADIGEASTVNGSIIASLGVSRWSEPLEFSTVNGSITVDFPEDLSAELHASTVNGTISTDFPMTVQGKFSKRMISGNVGRGNGGDLSLSTVNGSIHLRSGQ
jgi:hypothetical protein